MTLSGDGTITGLVAGGLPNATVTADDLAAGAALNNAPNSVGFRNRIINGDMRIDQRNAGAAVTETDQYTLDRFLFRNNTTGAASCQQVTDAPTGFQNSLKVTVTTADASLDAADRCFVRQWIEGYNSSDFAYGTASAKTVTVSFWVKSSLTGTFSLTLHNNDVNRCFTTSYSISVASTWEYKTISIPGETDGTWITTNGRGVALLFGLSIGSDNQGTLNTWNTSFKEGVSGAVNFLGTLDATWQVTGVQLEVGSVATPFERRPFGAELQLCQRYFEATYGPFGFGRTAAASLLRFTAKWTVRKRSSPSISGVGTFTVTDYFENDISQSAAQGLSSVQHISENSALVGFNNSTLTNTGVFGSSATIFGDITSTGAVINVSAEL
jgi:hypothetical protein